jgi:hypothetical protein
MTFPTVTITGDQIPCPDIEHDQAYYLQIYDTVFDPEWLTPWKLNKNSGYEQLQSYALLGQRLSLAVKHFWCSQFAMHADGPALATGFVTFERTTNGEALIVLAGSTVRTTDGRVYVTTEDAEFGELDYTASPTNVAVVAIAAGFDYNREGEVTTARGEVLPGDVNTIVSLLQSPAYTDPYVTVKNTLPITGGVCASLDVLGYDKGITRNPGEPDVSYRLRIRSLPDTVTPNAIRRQLAAYLDPYGIEWYYVEPWDLTYQTCWDAPSPNVGTPTYQAVLPANPKYDPNLFTYDDPRAEPPFFDRWLADVDTRDSFIIWIKKPDPSPFATPEEQAAFFLGLVQQINKVKPGGIAVSYEAY